VATGDVRRLALIVGVGDYKSDRVPKLSGTTHDARRMYDLLTGPNGYGFPKENVCLLLDGDATAQGFRDAFQKTLVDRAQPQDVVVLFYAGHGSQTRDRNHDEPDEMDETFVLQDSRTGDVGDLVDDEFNGMLSRVKSDHLTVILDACNSGTLTRDPDGRVVARLAEPDENPNRTHGSTLEGEGDGGSSFEPDSKKGLVVLSGAADGTSALEINGSGVFTSAISR
jgi:hypothetical protein